MSHATTFSVSFVSPDRGLFARQQEPVSFGIPMPRGLFHQGAEHLVEVRDGDDVVVAVDVLNRWPDGSARWLLASHRVSTDDAACAHLTFSVRKGRSSADADLPLLTADASGDEVDVDTGAIRVSFGPGRGWPVRSITRADGQQPALPDASGLRGTVSGASWCDSVVERVWIERANQAAVLVCASGHLDMDGCQLEVDWQFALHAQSPVMSCAVTLRNPRPATHPGGFWELGDPGSATFSGVEFRLALPPGDAERSVLVSAEPSAPLATVSLPFELYQEASGGSNWQSSNHVDRHGVVPMTFNGYRRTDIPDVEGARATPIAVVHGAATRCALATRYFWQNFPKALSADATSLTIALFPRQFPGGHELQGGEQKTHTFALAFAADGVSDLPLAWWRAPLLAVVAPAWVCDSQAVPFVSPESGDRDEGYGALVRQAIEGDHTFAAKRELIDEYGWRNFGDVYGDHEAAFHDGPSPLISHCNNQYDAIYGCAVQFLRSGDARWWPLADELAAHVTDIDIYHTDGDKSAYNHGLFWHTAHYLDAGKATHRTYPRVDGGPSGGPASEQNYATGLQLHYFLTGNPASRRACLELAQFVIDIDDGSKTLFRWLAPGDTGLASCSRSPDYHGPGRGPGNSVSALVDGYRLSGERKYFDKAEQLIARVVHPTQDIAALDLLDAENRWFYTVLLQALAKYLWLKIELGELDERYAYGRATLLHFAAWVADHEQPYLDTPEKLEFPTETWIAQDMRKAEVLFHAAIHAEGDERARFVARGSEFFSYCVNTLLADARRSFTRPVVLLLTNGLTGLWLWAHASASAPEPGWQGSWPTHQRFVPQKAIFLARATRGMLVGLLAMLAALLALMRSC